MKAKLIRIGKAFLFITPFLIGTLGYALGGDDILQSAFAAVSLYLMSIPDDPPNFLVEFARWTAPLATASSILLIVAAFHHRIHAFFIYLRGSSTAVYGPESEKKELLKQLGKNGIDGKDRFIKAHRYILLNSEAENLAFYKDNREDLEDVDVYLKCDSLPAQASVDSHLHLFCPEETAVRLFWKKNCLYKLCQERDRKLRIVLLGFGKLGSELLTSALQNNIFFPDQKIEYHIFADDQGYESTHTQLKQISDPVNFYSEPWSERLDIVSGADMTIVLEQANQLTLVQQLLFATLNKNIFIFSTGNYGIEILDGQDRLNCYDWLSETQKLENIVGTTLYERAKRINLRYAHLYNNVEETEENKEIEWDKLNTFTRYSNISSADYHEVQRQILTLAGVYKEGDSVPEAWLETLAELEHIRWNRYHFLNNWSYAPAINGVNKNPSLRNHALLVDYAKLIDAEKEKDRENIRILFSIN